MNSDLHPVRPGAKATYEDEEIIEAENEEVPHEEPKAETVEEKNVAEDEEKEAN